MKAIIVDDEKHVREAIKLLVDWPKFHIDRIIEAQDGLEAVGLIAAERPELIFTDMMMPLKSGMELLEWIRANAPSSKTIVVSGHDDFELVRHTVKFGGTDYILKPIDQEQLNEAVEKAMASWQAEEDERCKELQRSMEMNQIKPVYWDRLWSGLIDDPRTYGSAASALAAEFGIGPQTKRCALAVLSLETIDARLLNKFAAQKELLLFSLVNICNEFMRGEKHGFAFRYWNEEERIVLLFWDGLERVDTVIGRIDKGIERTLKCGMEYGISGIKPFPEGLQQAFQEALQALAQRNLLKPGKRIHRLEASRTAKGSLLAMSGYEEQLRFAVKSGSAQHIRQAVKQWIDAVKQLETITPEQLHMWENEYTVLRTRWLQELFGEDSAHDWPKRAIPAPLDEEGKLSVERWEHALESSLIELSRQLLDSQQREQHAVYEIAKYIQNHYHQDITLQDIAGHFYLSREYISRKFKQQFGVNISDYMTGIRMERAKLLLLNPTYRIAQVAGMVGYEDEKYFSKVFKKNVGLSPGEYRKAQGGSDLG